MKVTIEKVYNPINDEYYFYLIVDEPYYTKAFGFKPDAPEGNIYNEKANYEQALEIALRIEKTGSPSPTKEIVYQKEIPGDEQNVNPEAANQ